MRVFVTGATGFVGSAIVRDLIGAGHRVLGLARTDAAAAALATAGAQAHRGDLADLDSLRDGAARTDATIHTAFIHDFTAFKDNCEVDRRAIAALGEALEGTGRPLLVTSGTGLFTLGRATGEEDRIVERPGGNPRAASEAAADALAARGVRAAVVRLPPTVHGAGDHGFVPHLIALARQKGVSACIGDGANRWAAVHRVDAARLYRLALEDATPGARYHAVAEEAIPFRTIAEAIARGLGVPLATLAAGEAAAHFGWFAHFAGIDSPVSAAWTRDRLGWHPEQPELMADLAGAGYFPE